MKLEINHRKRNEKKNNYMETKQYATKKTSGSTMKLKNTLTQMPMKTQPYKNLWDTAKAVLRGKFIVIQAFLKKQEKGASLVAWRLRICLPMQGTWV